MLRDIVYEGLATFFLVFMTSMATNSMYKEHFQDIHYARAFIIGSQYAIYYFVGQRLSGGVLNPSVSLGLAFTRKLSVVKVS